MQDRHKMTRRWFLKCATVSVAGSALAACVPAPILPASEQQAGQVAAPPSAEELKMTMAAGGVPAPYGPAFERQARRFEEKWAAEKGQKVVVETILDPDWTVYHTHKVPTLVAAGTPPDVSWNSGEFVGPYVGKGNWVMILDDYIERDREIVDIEKDFAPIVKQASMYKGHYICFAEAGMVYQVTLFNKEFLAENGMPTPAELYEKGEWTWDTLDEMTRELAMRDDSDRPVQFGSTTEPYIGKWGLQARLWSYGADIYNDDESEIILDSEEGYRLAEVAVKALCEDRVAPRAEDKDIDWLASNKLGIGFGWPTAIAAWQAKYQFEFDVAPLPAGPEGWTPSASFDGWQIAQATAQPELAWQYVLFAVGPDEDMTRSTDWTRPPNHISNFEKWSEELLAQGRIKNIDYLRESMMKARLAHVLVPERPEFSTAYANLFQAPIEGCLSTGRDAVDGLAAELRRLIAERPA
jgi:ABC-type glycerol-3-phosphate transport system substrate-binding protein